MMKDMIHKRYSILSFNFRNRNDFFIYLLLHINFFITI